METLRLAADSAEQMVEIGETLGEQLRGGEVIVLKSDIGGGKTTLTKGIAKGFGSTDKVSSPSFTISYVYSRDDGKQLHHYDFYRLSDPGVVGLELAESVGDDAVVTIVEWGDIVEDVLPRGSITIQIKSSGDNSRQLMIEYPTQRSYLFEGLVK